MSIYKKNKSKNNFAIKDSWLGFAFGAFVVLGVFVYALYSSAAWSNPTANPTGNNVTPPIFTGTTTPGLSINQTRYGDLKLGTSTASTNFFVYNGGVSIATTTLNSKMLTFGRTTLNTIISGASGYYGMITGIGLAANLTDAVSKAYADAHYISGALPHGNILAGNWSNMGAATSTIFLQNGNVGIGTTNPSAKLDIFSNVTAPTKLLDFGNVIGGFYGYLSFDYSGNTTVRLNTIGGGSSLYLGQQGADLLGFGNGRVIIPHSTFPTAPGDPFLVLNGGGSSNNYVGMGFGYNPGGVYSSPVEIGSITTDQSGVTVADFYIATRPTNTNVAPTERMRVTSGGNVGIGTTNPAGTLNVASSLTKSSNGVGWSMISQDLTSMAAGVGGGLLFQGYKTGTSAVGNFGAIAAIKENGTSADENGSLLLYSSNAGVITERARITSGGNVGIGTTNPGSRLVVQSPTQATAGDLTVDTTNGASVVTVGRLSGTAGDNTKFIARNRVGTVGFEYDSVNSLSYFMDGKVGVGTTSPGAKLTVTGTAGPGDIFDVASSTYAKVLRVTKSGDLLVSGQVTAGPGDVAEEFYTDKDYPAGTVLVMDNEGYKSTRACTKKYDQTVIGVISEKPGMVVGQVEGRYTAPVALTGVVKVLVNATGGKIQRGDLLTTSAITGEAMKAADPKIGTLIGKALEPDTGKGWIMALVDLK